MNKRVISLFSGCGGLDLGFVKEGFNIIWANDKIDDVCETYGKNIGEHIICKDLNKINIKDIPDGDLLIGGPPCQSFSLLGKRNPADERGNLAWKFFDILDKKKPKIFLFENVTGIKSAKTENGNKVINEIKKRVDEIGYSLNTYTLNAANYGVPQKRKRVFLVGNDSGYNIGKPKPTHNENPMKNLNGNKIKRWVTSEKALSDLPEPSENEPIDYSTNPKNPYQELMRNDSEGVYNHYPPYSSEKDMEIIKSVPPGGNYMDVPDSIATQRILNFKETGGRTTTYGRLDPNEPSYTINTHFDRPNVGCNIHYSQDRLITLREGLRLQSFPDDFVLYSSTKRNYYLQVGNAVPPLLAEAWAKKIKEVL